MAGWSIYYGDGSRVDGSSRGDWKKAPSRGVQVVVRKPPEQGLRWHFSGGPVRDRDLWTGTDTFDPFGWGQKTGSLIPDDDYFAIWERACADD